MDPDAIKQAIWLRTQASSLDCPIINGFRLPTLGKCGNEWTMKAGRNDPCPCGSGKKYKKCCLPEGQLVPMAPPPIVEAHEPIADPVEDDWQEAETLDEVEAQEPGNIADEPERPPLHKYPRPEMKHEEFLFELGGELGRRGRTPDYIALLSFSRTVVRRWIQPIPPTAFAQPLSS